MKNKIEVTKEMKNRILDAFKDLAIAEAAVVDLIGLKRDTFSDLLVKAGVSPERAETISTCRTISTDSANKWLVKIDAMFEGK